MPRRVALALASLLVLAPSAPASAQDAAPQPVDPATSACGGDSRYIDPVVTWSRAEASPSGAVVAAGSFWVAALRGQRLWQVELDGSGGVGAVRAHFAGEFGRLRAVAQVPDGSLWVLTNESPGRVLRVPLG